MVKSITAAGGSRTAINIASVTRYLSFAGGDVRSGNSAITNFQMRATVAGTFSRFAIRVSANGRSTSTTANFRLNSATGAQTFAIAGGATGWFEDTTNSDAAAAGDNFAWSLTSGTGTGTISVTLAQVVFEASSGQKQIIGMGGPGQFNQTATTNYGSLSGSIGDTTESRTVTKVPGPGTFSNFQLYVSGNTLTLSTTTVRWRVNGANGNQVLSIPAGGTGWFEDTVNSDTVVAGDTVNWSRQGTGTGSGICTIDHGQVLWTPSTGRMLLGGNSVLARTAASATTEFYAPHGEHPKSATESAITFKAPYDGTLSGLRIRIPSGTFNTANATARIRINGADGNQNLSIPTGTTGFFEDTTNTDSVLQGDEITVRLVNSGISGTLYIGELSIDITEPQDIDLSPPGGEIEIEGGTPRIGTILTPAGGEIEIEGGTPDLTETITLQPAGSEIEIEGGLPILLQTEALASGAQSEILAGVDPAARSSSAALEALGEIIPIGRVSAAQAEILAEVIPEVRISSAALEILADGVDCLTRWQQLWKITRKDGAVLGFTSLDRDFVWGGLTYQACASLDPSAAESAANIGQIGSQDLRGIISSDAISEADLWAGLYDDAFVEVWIVPWMGTDTPRRLAAGWTGQMTQDDSAFNMEVLGPGKRIDQQALVQVYSPGCRWLFGGAECGVDIEGFARGGSVTAARNRHVFTATIDASGGSGGAAQWANGTVVWETGRNAGARHEFRSIDFDTGLIELWVPAGFMPEAGDEFRALPGCDRLKATCKEIYNNYLRFGGFWDVPGEDEILKTPDAKI